MKKVYIVMGIDFDGYKICETALKIFDSPVDAKRYYDIVADGYQFAYYTKEPVLSEFVYPCLKIMEKPQKEVKEYIDKEKLIRLIENAMFQAKGYDGKLDVDSIINILNNLKLIVKTMESIKITNKGETE